MVPHVGATKLPANRVLGRPDMPAPPLPLVADKDVDEAGFFGRAWSGLTSLFG